MADRMIHRARIEADGRPVLDDSQTKLFPWWSLTKTVLSVCALQLVASGRLALDDTLTGRPCTLRLLLQHRAGIPDYGGLAAYHDAVERGDEPWTVDDLLDRVGGDRLDVSPGNGWSYSNVGYLFVRRIIERTTGDDIGTVMQRLVVAPLGLRSVGLAMEPADLDGMAWGNPSRYHPGWVYHGLLTGTAMDAARFLDGLMSGRLLPADLQEFMTTRHPLGGSIPGRPWQTAGYGLGLMAGRMSEAGLAIGHSGCGPGSVCAVYHFPEAEPPCTAAAFARGEDEGVTEYAVAQLVA